LTSGISEFRGSGKTGSGPVPAETGSFALPPQAVTANDKAMNTMLQ
jgi:hypothetical protein